MPDEFFEFINRARELGLDTSSISVEAALGDSDGLLHRRDTCVNDEMMVTSIKIAPLDVLEASSFCEDCFKEIRTIQAVYLARRYGPGSRAAALVYHIEKMLAGCYHEGATWRDFHNFTALVGNLWARVNTQDPDGLERFREAAEGHIMECIRTWEDFFRIDENAHEMRQDAVTTVIPEDAWMSKEGGAAYRNYLSDARAAVIDADVWGVVPYDKIGSEFIMLQAAYPRINKGSPLLQAPMFMLLGNYCRGAVSVGRKLSNEVLEIAEGLYESSGDLVESIKLARKI